MGLSHLRTERSAALPLWKRLLDICMLVAFAPGILLVSGVVIAIIKLGSRGPILFKQPRIGYRGETFTCFKFRTMVPNADTKTHEEYTRALINSKQPMTKLDARGDTRLIAGGGLLRATGLDEVPQFLNVLRGEMSIVGPRPCIASEYKQYETWHKRRFEAVPGLTGLWQVSGKNKTTFEEMVRLDIHYAERRSLSLDLAIIAKTIPALWTQVRESRATRRRPETRSQAQIQNTVTTC